MRKINWVMTPALALVLTCAVLGCASPPPSGGDSAERSAAEPPPVMRGMYIYMADAALFSDCLSGRRLPVAMEADSISLERAYLEARQQPGDELLVSFEGRIVDRPPMEGDGLRPTVIVDRFIDVWPGESCDTHEKGLQ